MNKDHLPAPQAARNLCRAIRKYDWLLAASALLCLLAAPLSSYAAGTLSGTTISNSALLKCNICGAAGITTTPVSFVVDNKVNLLTTSSTGAVVGVTAGQVAAVSSFTVANLGNTVQDYGLTTVNIASGAVLYGGTDNFDATACVVRVESGSVPGYDPTDTATFIDELAPDASRVVYVVCNIPSAQIGGDQAIISLSATTLQGGIPGTQGAITAATVGANTAVVDVVLADIAGSDDAARDGKHAARGAFRIGTATTLNKTIINIQDPFGCSAPPGTSPACKIVSGSTLTYRVEIIITGSDTLTGLVLSDPIPANMSYVAGSIVANGSAKTDAADGDQADFGVTASNTVTLSSGTVNAPLTSWFTFRATIN